MVKITLDEREQESIIDREGLIVMTSVIVPPGMKAEMCSCLHNKDHIHLPLINPDKKYKHEYIIIAFPKDISAFPKKIKD